MKTSVIIISKTKDSANKLEYNKYFDDVYVITSIDELSELFNKIYSDYLVVVTENEFYAEDSYMLYTYIQSHDLDFIVGNRTYTHQYMNTDNFYKMCNKKSSNRLSKITGKYIPDLFSTSYVLSRAFYKQLTINSNFQLDCIKQSKKFAYIDIRYNTQKYSKLYSIKQYISAKLYERKIKKWQKIYHEIFIAPPHYLKKFFQK